MQSKQGFEESLGKEVVETRRCVGCATCVVVCPFKCLDYTEGIPTLVKPCENCGICPRVCPVYNWSRPKAEEAVFGRQRRESEEFGIHRRLLLAQSTDKDILRRSQDGGAVTALLAHALRSDLVEGVALSGLNQEKPLLPTPKLATTEREVIENAGTRYSYSPNMLALQEGVNQKKKSLAFVGTPCQIHALRKMQMFPLKKYSNPLQFCIGLMCTESFTYDGFFEEHLEKKMGVSLRDVKKMNIKGKVLIHLKSGETKSIPLSEAKQYTRSGCQLCSDFSAELADISAGGLGLNGWTFVIPRTVQGEKIFDSALEAGVLRSRAAAEEPFARKLLTKLSRKKQQRSPRNST